ncbi:MAG: enoyl-CoA hydratase [Actinobacteria bacterium]|nr:enoyl-CoA hydratase [Actinomycetota bacterium]
MSDPTTETVVVREQHGHVLVLRLNRPEARNALNSAMIGALGAAIQEAEEGDDIRVLVITGTGDRAFCSGMDLRAFSEGDTPAPGAEAASGNFMRLMRGEVTVPVIAAVQASAVAGGFEIVMGCDLVVASGDAKFGLPEVKRALFPGGDGILLATRIPLPIALEINLTGDYIDAERAYALGLVNRVVPADQVLDAALELAGKIAANGPLGVKATKELVRLAVTSVEQAHARQKEWFPVVFRSEDAVEGATAFVEKRDPVWKGR